MLTTVAKRVQSRLSRKEVKIELKDIRNYLENNVLDVNNITSEEINQAADYFMSTTTKLTIIQEDVEPMTSNEAVTELETLTNNNSEELEPETTLETTPETSICVDVENGNILPALTGEPETSGTVHEVNTLTTGNNSHPVTAEQDTENLPQSQHQVDRTGWYQPAPLATTEKSELITSTAANLGIALSTEDIENIANNFDNSSDDFTETLEQVKSAIIAYVQHKIASNNQQIVNTINEISQVASDGFEENSQTLTNGLKRLNQQLVQQSTDFKSQLAGTLSRFKLPAAS
ncbi:MAG: DUF2226 domain-containing protein [Cuspidothrix sp.]